MRLQLLAVTAFIFGVLSFGYAQSSFTYVTEIESGGTFPLIKDGQVPALLISDDDYPGVLRVGGHFQADLEKVSGIKPQMTTSESASGQLIIVGTLGKSPVIDKLAREGKIDTSLLEGKWEKFTTQIINNPMDGVDKALVIAGSDKRGTIYGMYDLSEQMGVSPWYFWADVPVVRRSGLYVLPGTHTRGEPKVKYRGIFINDEAPALSGYVYSTYGGFNAEFYDTVFELILRMKGNYLWPAMWGRMFYVDDPKNAELADEYGVVIGTSHHEPLTRAHAEWERFGEGPWDYTKNAGTLEKFWREGMERRGDTEAIVTIGMRGDGDEPMTQGTAIELLENIVTAQRNIIAEVTGKPAEQTPQLWALYKEVQDYYDQGMRVPDDVTLLLCDDNWGNIRKLPELNAEPREGGYGIYYHYDYVGGPRNYKWLNTNQIERTWEQMNLAYQYGADEVWIVNVGDIKPMELPVSFFLNYAWDPEAIDAENLQDYYVKWAGSTFNGHFTEEIAEVLRLYTKYNARRKPELLEATTYSLKYFNEAERVLQDFKDLAETTQKIADQLPEEFYDAYYQLVLFPVLASANLNELYIATAKNLWYAEQGRISTNNYAEKVKELFERDQKLTDTYHNDIADGKWDHVMSQTHIGYTYWQQPEKNTMPGTLTIKNPEKAEMGIWVENTEEAISDIDKKAALPVLFSTGRDTLGLVIFNKGKRPFDFKIKTDSKWLRFSTTQGKVSDQTEVEVNINWEKLGYGKNQANFRVSGAGKEYDFIMTVNKIDTTNAAGFAEANGYVAMESKNYSRSMAENPFEWKIVENLGRTSSAMMSSPVLAGPLEISETSPRLEYDIFLQTAGTVKVQAYFSPTLNYTTREGLKYGIGFDAQEPVIVNVHGDNSDANWNKSVADNIKILTSTHSIQRPGNHTLKFYRVDSGLVLQRIEIETVDESLKETYLGPPESRFFPK